MRKEKKIDKTKISLCNSNVTESSGGGGKVNLHNILRLCMAKEQKLLLVGESKRHSY